MNKVLVVLLAMVSLCSHKEQNEKSIRLIPTFEFLNYSILYMWHPERKSGWWENIRELMYGDLRISIGLDSASFDKYHLEAEDSLNNEIKSANYDSPGSFARQWLFKNSWKWSEEDKIEMIYIWYKISEKNIQLHQQYDSLWFGHKIPIADIKKEEDQFINAFLEISKFPKDKYDKLLINLNKRQSIK